MGMDAFHALFRRVSDLPVESNTGTFGLLERVAVDTINQLPERNRFFPGLRSWVGFRTGEVLYDRQERAAERVIGYQDSDTFIKTLQRVKP